MLILAWPPCHRYKGPLQWLTMWLCFLSKDCRMQLEELLATGTYDALALKALVGELTSDGVPPSPCEVVARALRRAREDLP